MSLLDFSEVRRRTGLGRTTVWRMEREGRFPKRLVIGPTAVRWREDEIIAWMESLPRGRGVTPPFAASVAARAAACRPRSRG